MKAAGTLRVQAPDEFVARDATIRFANRQAELLAGAIKSDRQVTYEPVEVITVGEPVEVPE